MNMYSLQCAPLVHSLKTVEHKCLEVHTQNII